MQPDNTVVFEVRNKVEELAYSDLYVKLMSIHDNAKDLMIPFQNKHYYEPSMQGATR